MGRVVDVGVRHPGGMELRDARAGALAELLDGAELDRLRRTRLRTRRHEAGLLAVVAEGALERAAVGGAAVDDAERAGHDAVAAAVADVRLHINAAELRAHDRAGGTAVQTAGRLAVLADVGGERPRPRLRGIPSPAGHRGLLDELHMAPRGVAESERVVVGEAAPVQTI